jgi:hypothetical protein
MNNEHVRKVIRVSAIVVVRTVRKMAAQQVLKIRKMLKEF